MLRKDAELRETGRVEAFSDGVFAIALTLLMLELHLPKDSDITRLGGLFPALLSMWSGFAAYVLGFVFVLTGWINHHKLVTHLRTVDGAALILNGMLLFTFTVIPFPVSLHAAPIADDGAKTAIIIFCSCNLFVAVAYHLFWKYSSKSMRLLRSDMNVEMVQAITREYNIVLPIYFIAFVLSFIMPFSGLCIDCLLLIYFAVHGFRSADVF